MHCLRILRKIYGYACVCFCIHAHHSNTKLRLFSCFFHIFCFHLFRCAQTALTPPATACASVQTIGFVGTRTELLTAAEARVLLDAVEDKAVTVRSFFAVVCQHCTDVSILEQETSVFFSASRLYRVNIAMSIAKNREHMNACICTLIRL